MKQYQITVDNIGAIRLSASSKKEAFTKFLQKGYDCRLKDICLVTW